MTRSIRNVICSLGFLYLIGSSVATAAPLVVVNLEDIAIDIARDLDVNVSNIPITVEAPIGIAANVCDIAVNVLVSMVQSGGGSCDAEATSTALNQLVSRNLINQ